MDRRPQGLTIVGIVMLVVGLLSTCCNAWGIASIVMNLGIAAAMTHSGAPSPDMEPLVRMQRDVAVFTGIPALLGIAAALFVVAAGGLALAMKPMGRVIAISALGTILFVALIDAGMSAVGTMRMMATVTDLAASGGPGAAPMGGSMGMFTAYGIGMSVVWLVLKLAVYVPCLVYFLRPETKALFVPPEAVGVRGE